MSVNNAHVLKLRIRHHKDGLVQLSLGKIVFYDICSCILFLFAVKSDSGPQRAVVHKVATRVADMAVYHSIHVLGHWPLGE